jgi:hypothetical protein
MSGEPPPPPREKRVRREPDYDRGEDEYERGERGAPLEYPDEDEGAVRRRRRVRGRPHRGGLILTLGILSLVCCGPLGIVSLIMGSMDLGAMQRGEMDRSGQGMTRAGQILGIVAVAWMVIAFFIFVVGQGGRRF